MADTLTVEWFVIVGSNKNLILTIVFWGLR
jgi:hypothetical protein